MKPKLKTLIVDNFDSFTYNLFHQCSLSGGNPDVILNNEISLREIGRRNYTHLILSAGPGTVEKEEDFGVCGEILEKLSGTLPILGVCLGHQGIVQRFGGTIRKAPQPMHGKQSSVRVDQHSPLFRRLPGSFEVMRYHSLIAAKEDFPSELEVIAETTGDSLIMGVSHRQWPLYGVQFHPESIGTLLGRHIMKNFLSL